MRPLLGIVFSPSDKIELTGPRLHTIVTNSLVTERRPDWDPNITCNGECPDADREQVRCQKQEITQTHVFCCPTLNFPWLTFKAALHCCFLILESIPSAEPLSFYCLASPRLWCVRTFSCLALVHFVFSLITSPAQPFLPLSQLDSLLLLLYFIKGLYLFIYLKFKMTKLIKLWIWNTCIFQIQCIRYAKRKFGLVCLCKAETTFQI